MVLVTGATGTLGAHLTTFLVNAGYSVIALKRKTSNLDYFYSVFRHYAENPEDVAEKIFWVDADITDYTQLFFELENHNFDYIFHCAAYVSFKNKNKTKFYETNYIGTQNIVNLALERKIKKFIHISSIATLDSKNRTFTTEKDLINPNEKHSYYAITKYLAELEIFKAAEEGLNYIILKPSVILAPYKLSKSKINLFKKICLKYSPTGKKGFVFVNDVAKVAINTAFGNITNEVFIVSGENLSFIDFVKKLNNAFCNKKIKVKSISKTKLAFIGILSNLLTLGFSPLNKTLIDIFYNDEVYSTEKLKTTMEFDFTPVDKALKEISKYYEKQAK